MARRSRRRRAGRGDVRGRRRAGSPAAATGGQAGDPASLLFIERSRIVEPVAVEVDRPLAFHPKLVGFWRGMEFYLITRMIATRREYDATYHRVVTDRGAFDLRHIRRMDSQTLRIRKVWELCAELEATPLAQFR